MVIEIAQIDLIENGASGFERAVAEAKPLI